MPPETSPETYTPETPTSADNNLSRVVISLFKGVLYQDEQPELWHSLLSLQIRVRDYVNVAGLELILDEAEGYAFLRSRPEDPEEQARARPAWFPGASFPFRSAFSSLCCAKNLPKPMPAVPKPA